MVDADKEGDVLVGISCFCWWLYSVSVCGYILQREMVVDDL